MEEKKKKGRIREYIRQLKEQMIKKHNGTFVLYIVLRILVIAVLVLSLIEKRYESVNPFFGFGFVPCAEFSSASCILKAAVHYRKNHTSFYIRSGNNGRAAGVLYSRSLVGYDAAYDEWIFIRGFSVLHLSIF